MDLKRAWQYKIFVALAICTLVAAGCAARQTPSRDQTPPAQPHQAFSPPSKASASSSIEPEAAPKTPASASDAPVSAATDGLLGIESEQDSNVPTQAGFGPPEGSTAEFGMIDLLAQPPAVPPKRRANSKASPR